MYKNLKNKRSKNLKIKHEFLTNQFFQFFPVKRDPVLRDNLSNLLNLSITFPND